MLLRWEAITLFSAGFIDNENVKYFSQLMWNLDKRVSFFIIRVWNSHQLFTVYEYRLLNFLVSINNSNAPNPFIWCMEVQHLYLATPFQLLIWDSGFPVPGQGKWRPLSDESSATISQSESDDNVGSANQKPPSRERLLRILKGEWRLERSEARGIFSSFNVTLIYFLKLLEDYLILMM